MIEKIEIQNLSHQFQAERKLFDQVNFVLPSNEIVFFDGGIGSGRSTLLKMLAGLLLPQQGSVVINGQPVSELSFEEFLPTRLKIGYSFEYAGLLNNRTLRENLLLPIQYHSHTTTQEAYRKVDELCEVFSLTNVANQRPFSVSGSQRKACVVARAFALDPELILLDEPFSGLSSASVSSLRNFISLQMETGILKHVYLSCQNERDVENWANGRVFVEATKFTYTSLSKPHRLARGA